jgi:tRNA pseudouridine38-40 synthase
VRYFLKLSFNGKNYHGWQIQQNAHSVQAELDNALSVFFKETISTVGCGRTDTGVHAKMFYAHFDFHSPVERTEDIIHHLNCLLPFDISISRLVHVDDDAHARFDAVSRTYQYYIYHDKNPFLKEWAYFFPYMLDLEKMNHACMLLKEHTDFSSFSKSRTQVKTNICKISEASWRKENNQVVFRITADRFLRNMVRAIVGTMLDVGENKINENQFVNIIEGKSRSRAGVSVPAHGLYLEEVKYGIEIVDD